MAIALTIVLIFIVIAGTIWLLYREKPAPDHRTTRHASPTAGAHPTAGAGKAGGEPEHMWVLEIESPGCEAAQALAGRKFTPEDAPELPLEECKAPICNCRYLRQPEHRKQHRRQHPDRRAKLRFDNERPERRSRKDRRSGNWDDRAY